MDARTDMVVGSTGRTGEILQPPLLGFLARCHAEIAGDHSGAVADYIPELTKADAGDFGISIATTDGYVYEVGDSDVPFTISPAQRRSYSRWLSKRSARRKWKA